MSDDVDEIRSPQTGQKLVRRPKRSEVKPLDTEEPSNETPGSDDESSDRDDEEDDENEEVLHLELPARAPEPAPLPVRPVAPTNLAPKKPEALEDLYAYFPDIGNGIYRLRIVRDQPKSYGGYSIKGHIEDIDVKIPMASFVARYGGGSYTVSVIGPAGRSDAQKTLANITVEIGGPPAMSSIPMGEDDMMGGPRAAYPQQQAPQVEVKRLELEAQRQAREDDERRVLRAQAAQGQQTPEFVVTALREQSDKHSENMRLSLQNMATDLRTKEEENRALRDSLVKERSISLEAVKKAEQDLERRLKDAHDGLLNALTQRHTTELAALKDQHARDLQMTEIRNKERFDDITRRNEDSLKRLENDTRNERERILADSANRVTMLKDTYEARITDLTRTTERELLSVREQRDREINAIRSTAESSEKFSKTSTDLRVGTMTDEIARLRIEVDSLKKENIVLHKAQNKDPLTFLRETKEMAGHLGMVDAADIPTAKEDSEEVFDWKKEATKGAIAILHKVPDIARDLSGSLAAARAQNQQIAAQQQQQMRMQQQHAQQQQQGRRRGVAPSPWSGSGSMSPVAPDITFQPPIPPRIIVQQADPSMSATSVSVAPPPMGAVPVPPAPVATTVQDPVQQPAHTQQQMEDGIKNFIDQLEAAIRGDIYTPGMFAKGFIDTVGPVQAAALIHQVPVEKFIELIENQAGSGGTAILTRDGKTYVRGVWSEGAALINQMMQTGQP